MRKAIRLEILLWLRGEDEPAHDYAASSIEAARRIIEAGRAACPELELTIESIRENDDYDSEEEDVGAEGDER